MNGSNEIIIVTFYRGIDNKPVGRYYDGRVIVIAKDSKISVREGETWNCEIKAILRKTIIVEPIGKIDVTITSGLPKLINNKDVWVFVYEDENSETIREVVRGSDKVKAICKKMKEKELTQAILIIR